MSSIEINETYEKLLQIYREQYRNPKVALNYHIDELMKEGKTRREAILTLYERKRKRIEVQTPIERRVKELEKELHELKMSKTIEAENAKVRIPSREGLSFGEALVILLFSPIAAIIAWLIWHEDKPYKADQAVSIGIIVFILEIIVLWFFFLS